jgi:hypothetical protein
MLPRGLVRRDDAAEPEQHASLILEQAMSMRPLAPIVQARLVGLIVSMAAAQQASV